MLPFFAPNLGTPMATSALQVNESCICQNADLITIQEDKDRNRTQDFDALASLASSDNQSEGRLTSRKRSDADLALHDNSNGDDNDEREDSDAMIVDIGLYVQHREDPESIELARQLMAEEAMLSYQQHFEAMLQHEHPVGQHLSPEDIAALRAAMYEEEAHFQQLEEEEGLADMDDEEGNISYETLLQLGERIGNVKAERWAIACQKEISKLPLFEFKIGGKPCSGQSNSQPLESNQTLDDSEWKCLVCQNDYEQGDHLRRLPCKHAFHQECVDQWLMSTDGCPYCRQSIVHITDGKEK